ncbi:MAG TPA: trehalase family glycosidase, partial [Opitutaceae bacterium]|nr:trehalase family glycosidase [Opitutaceae bacterium]
MRLHPRLRVLALPIIAGAFLTGPCRAQEYPRSAEYAAVQHSLAQGWNTWDVYNVTEQVLLPEGFAVRIGLEQESSLNSAAMMPDLCIGGLGNNGADVFAGPHTWNGSYCEARVTWKQHIFLLQSAHHGEDVVMLATPLESGTALAPTLVVTAGILWQRPGSASMDGGHIRLKGEHRATNIFVTGRSVPPEALPVSGPYLAATFDGPVGISTGRERTIGEIRSIIEREKPGARSVRDSIQSVMGWDTIYDPSASRVISPVSRMWSIGWGGYVLFDWDTFFASSLAATGDRELAYANTIEVLNEETSDGFVPNYARPGGWKSFDRSEPPVGAVTVMGLYGQFHDTWFVRDTFDPLMRWNRWWDRRRNLGGYLVLGSDPDARKNPDDPSAGTLQGAKYESGLDNSPMYDDAPFDKATGRIHIADVGLMGLYVADCNALADMAAVLGRHAEEAELRARSLAYTAKLQTLWDEKAGIFLNRNLDTGESLTRLSPNNFYPMLARAATPAQALRMVKEHLLNPAEFWGYWVIPSIARNDPAFKDQNYWRG